MTNPSLSYTIPDTVKAREKFPPLIIMDDQKDIGFSSRAYQTLYWIQLETSVPWLTRDSKTNCIPNWPNFESKPLDVNLREIFQNSVYL